MQKFFREGNIYIGFYEKGVGGVGGFGLESLNVADILYLFILWRGVFWGG